MQLINNVLSEKKLGPADIALIIIISKKKEIEFRTVVAFAKLRSSSYLQYIKNSFI